MEHYANPLVDQVSKKDFEDFDYVLCMDESNLSDLKVRKTRARARK